jgi:hypothetical protein
MAVFIKKRNKSHGHIMQSSPLFAFFSESDFWKEAATINEQSNDAVICFLLSSRRIIIFVSLIMFITFAFVIYDNYKITEIA